MLLKSPHADNPDGSHYQPASPAPGCQHRLHPRLCLPDESQQSHGAGFTWLYNKEFIDRDVLPRVTSGLQVTTAFLQ